MIVNFRKLRQLWHRLRGRHIEFDLKPYQKLLTEINKREHKFETAEDWVLKEASKSLVTRARDGIALDDLLVEAFALVREGARRVLGLLTPLRAKAL
jgi:preprotein translocase subunit SecA